MCPFIAVPHLSAHARDINTSTQRNVVTDWWSLVGCFFFTSVRCADTGVTSAERPERLPGSIHVHLLVVWPRRNRHDRGFLLICTMFCRRDSFDCKRTSMTSRSVNRPPTGRREGRNCLPSRRWNHTDSRRTKLPIGRQPSSDLRHLSRGHRPNRRWLETLYLQERFDSV